MKSRERNKLVLQTLQEIRDGINILVARSGPDQSGQIKKLHDSTESLAQVIEDMK